MAFREQMRSKCFQFQAVLQSLLRSYIFKNGTKKQRLFHQ